VPSASLRSQRFAGNSSVNRAICWNTGIVETAALWLGSLGPSRFAMNRLKTSMHQFKAVLHSPVAHPVTHENKKSSHQSHEFKACYLCNSWNSWRLYFRNSRLRKDPFPLSEVDEAPAWKNSSPKRQLILTIYMCDILPAGQHPENASVRNAC
jgi:hypothetical protein